MGEEKVPIVAMMENTDAIGRGHAQITWLAD